MYNAQMAELVYAQIFLTDGRVTAWSSSRGRLEPRPGPWEDLFKWVRAREPEAKLMLHIIGDEDGLDDNRRINLMDKARDVGFSVVRFESGEPLLDPEEAFQLMLIPFT